MIFAVIEAILLLGEAIILVVDLARALIEFWHLPFHQKLMVLAMIASPFFGLYAGCRIDQDNGPWIGVIAGLIGTFLLGYFFRLKHPTAQARSGAERGRG